MKRIVRVAYDRFEPGDEVELPDGSTYDESLFVAVAPEPEPESESEPVEGGEE